MTTPNESAPAGGELRQVASEALALLQHATFHDGRYDQMATAGWQKKAQKLLPRLEAALSAPAIAPGGDAEVMRKVLDMLQSGLWEDAEDFLEAHVTALPAPANAVTVDDESDRGALLYLMRQFDGEMHVCERCGHEESTADYDSAIYLRDHLQKRLHPAALAPAAHTCDFMDGLDDCAACKAAAASGGDCPSPLGDWHEPAESPADPPAAGDVRVVVADLRRLGKEDGWLCATAGADIIEELRQQLAAAIAERDRAVKDAARYRWLRSQQFSFSHDRAIYGVSSSKWGQWPESEFEWDVLIDAVRADAAIAAGGEGDRHG